MTEAGGEATHAAMEPAGHWLEHLPVTFFAVLMGLFGLTLAFHAASASFAFAAPLALAMLWAGLATFVLIAALYVAKTLRHPGAVAAEWRHPVKIAFFPTISISLLLMSTAFASSYPAIAEPVWIVGMTGQGVLTIAVISGWISHRAFQVGHLTPAWFIPAVGNVIVPLAGVELGWTETSWLFFSAGMIFWVVLLTLVFNRLIFHDPIPARLFPTMVILIAPPALAFVAYVRLTGGVDPAAKMLVSMAYAFTALVLVQVPKLRTLPFALSWWALSFPLAALSIASFTYGRAIASPLHEAIGLVVLAALVLVVAGLAVRTVVAALRGEICRPD
ncbi:SLAC1 anion channel family protein [Roseibacterium sp. SDUM158017]|uniref:SLAC1 anion channel family protein n=1 Tax=Roseicyclus salinarum TaxID=3036773 RepID=UPI002414D4CE|nr:SLAC1 anion channel family protein [Roseibacterium sp. SDUM158017]MDG4648353.1 SLAC1 anion channel family protein [Roseibacterium sp. SDUM158017]